MGAGGCISTQQTQKKGLEGAQDIIVGNHVRGEHEFKDGAAVIEHHRVSRVFVEAQRVLQAGHMYP